MLAPSLSATWRQVRVRARSPKTVSIEFRFYPEYARSAWLRPLQAGTPFTTRGDSFSDEQELLLLQDTIYIEDAAVHVTAWRVPALKPNHYHVRVEIAAPQKFSRPLRLVLQWDKHKYIGIPLKPGQMLFEDISPPDFSRYTDNVPNKNLCLKIEFDNSGKNGKH